VFIPFSHIRINWKKEGWSNLSTHQVRVIENKDKAAISIHQENLLDSAQRDEMKFYWTAIMSEISAKIISV